MYFISFIVFLNCSKDGKNPVKPSTLVTVTDIDGTVYQTVKIGNQWWMAENLKVTHYRNGDAIPNVTGNTEWNNLTTGAYCNYDNNSNNAATYGRLYNCYAVNDSGNIAPAGWHVPSDNEWKTLEMTLGMSQTEADRSGMRGTDEGFKLKETGTSHWQIPDTLASNESGFTALPGGIRYSVGPFDVLGVVAFFWSSTEGSNSTAWYRGIGGPGVFRGSIDKHWGYSVRCVRD
ncbi:hypothetical protein A2Y85_07915 [candidate division WOR-3 bacterium RBG_13_43_14]|uniref:Fibrobacter succinogenes major paralogous domain-containing protein n=1 Tax=candidate division WOR-3 bacterium RBG_13_43_14 TaxID=1802590 RepID=A0A1F4UBV6_UNCW3|nr:MAG: hypothetical protein A2Y85_07915 [candidate division WOR-3 bacterium RBG_13_43_14]